MAILKRRICLSSGNVGKKIVGLHVDGRSHAIAEFKIGRSLPGVFIENTWWTPFGNNPSLRAFRAIDVHRAPHDIEAVEVRAAGSGRIGKIAIMIYVADFTPEVEPRAADTNLDVLNSFKLQTNTGAGGLVRLRLPAATEDNIGLQFFFEVTAAQNLRIVTNSNSDLIVRRKTQVTSNPGNSRGIQSNTIADQLVLECRQQNRWRIAYETSPADDSRWALGRSH